MWRKVLRLHVGPQGLRGSVWRGRRLLAQAEAQASTADAPLATLDGLLATLAGQTALRGVRADVEFADALIILDVVDGDFADHSKRQLQAIATACVAELIGSASASHELRWQLQSDERHLLICALPRDLLAALGKGLAPHGIAMNSAQPQLCSTWNHHLRHLGRGPVVLALASSASTTIACLHDGAISALARFASDTDALIASLDAQVQRLQASLGLDGQGQGRYLLVADRVPTPGTLERWTLLPGEAATVKGSRA